MWNIFSNVQNFLNILKGNFNESTAFCADYGGILPKMILPERRAFLNKQWTNFPFWVGLVTNNQTWDLFISFFIE